MTDIYYCLCQDHSQCGVCMDMVVWLVTNGIISPPRKWSCDCLTGLKGSVSGEDFWFAMVM